MARIHDLGGSPGGRRHRRPGQERAQDHRRAIESLDPPGTEDLSEEQLARLVTRDCPIEVAVPSYEGVRIG